MISTYRRLRHRAARTKLRSLQAWLQHRGLRPEDVFLASYERSGSTWLRFVLFEILTQGTAKFENVNQAIPEMRFQRGVQPVLPGSRRLIKSHEPYRPAYRRAVYLVRDLRDVLLSNYARHEESGYAAFHTQGRGFDGYLLSFLQGKVAKFGSWQQHVTSWLDSPLADSGDLLVVRYEDLRQSTGEILPKILNFLGVPADMSLVRKAVENNSLARMRQKEDASRQAGGQAGLLKMHKSSREDGRFVRQGAVGGWRAKLTAAQLGLIDAYAGEQLQRVGYPLGCAPASEAPEPARVN